jgi:Peptidase family M1 domain
VDSINSLWHQLFTLSMTDHFDKNSSISKQRILYALLIFFALICVPQYLLASRTPDWQQAVTYEMDLTLDESQRSIGGDAHITYTNNSPDTLSSLWFRLAPAALQGGSVVDTIAMRSRHRHWSDQKPETWGDLKTGDAKARDSHSVTFEQDFSIGQLLIDPPLLPGESVAFTLPFVTTLPSGGSQSRMGSTKGQFKGAYWYPQICPYTPEFGWTVNRYFGTAEAYGEFADFTIHYTVPNKYIIASTGELINEADVLPPDRMQGLSLDNPDPMPIPTGEQAERLVTWTFQAKQVPDVAFAMDPNFLIDRVDFGHFEAWSYSRRDVDEDWSNAAEIIGWTITELEKIYGPYPWPRVQASYSWSAMEYPMLTLMTSGNPRYVQVMIHEVVHNYNPMILQSNSVDEQWIDEGFTTFFEHHLLSKYENTRINKHRTYTRGLFSKKMIVADDDVRGQRPYLEAVLAGEDLPMVRASDTADDYPLLRVSSYYKTPVMLNTLRSVIGEEAFWQGFRVLYERHALTHVSGDDVVSSFEDAAGRSLKWFFDQFMYSAKDLDYSLHNVEFVNDQVSNSVSFDVNRTGELRIPLSLGIVTESGDTLRGAVPFLPTDQVPDGVEVWGTWDQWHMPNDEIHITVDLPYGTNPETVMLDPSGYWTDREPADNQWPERGIDFRFDPILTPMELPSLSNWQLNVSPTLGYNRVSGLLAGYGLRGSFLEKDDIFMADALLRLDPNKDALPQFRFGYATPLNQSFGPVYATLYGGNMHKDIWLEAGLRRSWRSWTHFYDRATISLKAGSWGRSVGIPSAVMLPAGSEILDNTNHTFDYSEPDDNDDYDGVTYVRARAEFSGRVSRSSYTHQFTLTVAADSDFSNSSWSFDMNTPLLWGWSLGTESRLSVIQGNHELGFVSTPGGAAPYEVLGDPFFGGAWETVSHVDTQTYSTIPRVYAPAALASDLGRIQPDRFLVLRFAQTHKLPGFLRKTNLKSVDRFLDRIRIGTFESGMLYQLAYSEVSAYTSAAEIGIEASVVDLYGLTLSARLAPVYSSDVFANEWNQYKDWNSEQWLDQFVIFVKLDLDPYFR